jgi:DNA processing protein
MLRLLHEKFSLQEIFEGLSRKDLQELKFSEQSIADFLEGRRQIDPEEEVEKIKKAGAKLLMPTDSEYPFLLKQIHIPPLFLFQRGADFTLEEGELSLAIVGARAMTSYSENVIEALVGDLIHKNVSIVSGLAYGVDAKAHLETVKHGGKAVAVLGCGIDEIYPAENRKLGEEILENGGTIFSEYSPGTIPLKFNFPARNRIISGLSHGTLVIQAGEKSGALITAKQALDEGREVMSIPGNILSTSHLGSNKLLSDGAHLITSTQDILNIFSQALVQLKKESNFSHLSEEERALLELTQTESQNISHLPGKLKFSLQKISSLLTSLEMQGLVSIEGEQVSAK